VPTALDREKCEGFRLRPGDAAYSATVLGFFWSATMKTRIFVRLSGLGFRDVEWIAVGGS
jgi:hypothetical protein